MKEKLAEEFGFTTDIKFKKIKQYSIDHNMSVIGFIDIDHECRRAPDNDELVKPTYRLIYLEEGK